MVMRKTFFCAAFAGALGLGASAAPVSLESAQDYVRTIAGTNASNVVLYSPTEAVKIIDTVFKPNREDVSDWPDWKFEQMKHLVADGFAALIGYDDIEHEDGNWEKTFATREYRLVHRFHDPVSMLTGSLSARIQERRSMELERLPMNQSPLRFCSDRM